MDRQQNQVPDFISTNNTVRTDKDLIVKDRFKVSDQNVTLNLGQLVKRIGVSGVNGTIYAAVNDYILGFTSLAFTPALVLPRPAQIGLGKIYVVKDEAGQAASTTITITSAGGELIDGVASNTITTNYGARSYYTEGNNWLTF